MAGKEEETLKKHDGSSAGNTNEDTGERKSSHAEVHRKPENSQTTRKKRSRQANEDSTQASEPDCSSDKVEDSAQVQSESLYGGARLPLNSLDLLTRQDVNHHLQLPNPTHMGIANPMFASLIEAQRQVTLLPPTTPALGNTGALNASALLPQSTYLQSATAINLQNYLQSAVTNTALNQILLGHQVPTLFPQSIPGVVSGSYPLGMNLLQSLLPVSSQPQQHAPFNPASAEQMRPQKRQRIEGSSSLPRVLALPEDHDILSAHQIFLRYQIEAFFATGDDVSTHTRGRNKPVTLGQVGIRCRYCANLPVGQRQKGSTYFPASLLGLYQAAQNMWSTHMQSGLCNEMPLEVRQQFTHLLSSKVSGSGSGRAYWARAGAKLGLVDTEDGIRLAQHIEADRESS